jgi:hypothetical protein
VGRRPPVGLSGNNQERITLGSGMANVVTVTIKALNGNGIDTENENDQSVVSVHLSLKCGSPLYTLLFGHASARSF